MKNYDIQWHSFLSVIRLFSLDARICHNVVSVDKQNVQAIIMNCWVSLSMRTNLQHPWRCECNAVAISKFTFDLEFRIRFTWCFWLNQVGSTARRKQKKKKNRKTRDYLFIDELWWVDKKKVRKVTIRQDG